MVNLQLFLMNSWTLFSVLIPMALKKLHDVMVPMLMLDVIVV